VKIQKDLKERREMPEKYARNTGRLRTLNREISKAIRKDHIRTFTQEK